MAELIIKTSTSGPDPQWQDDDIIHAMNGLRIYDVHAQHICHKNLIGFKGDGLRPDNSLTEMYLSRVKRYKTERISKTEVRRTNLVTLEEEVLREVFIENRWVAVPNTNGEYIHVQEAISRKVAHDRHLVFGTPGNERWYGGKTIVSTLVIDDIWTEIESRTANLKADFGKFPWGLNDQKDHLVITVNDFDNTERSELELSVYDNADPPVMTKRRKNKVDWRNLPGMTQEIIDAVNAVGTKVDIRDDFSFTRSQIVVAKSAVIEP